MLKYDLNPEKYKVIYDNVLNITDMEILKVAESEFVNIRYLALLKNKNYNFDNFDIDFLKKIHKYLFQDIYPWAGVIRFIDLSKGNAMFCLAQYIPEQIKQIDKQIKEFKKVNNTKIIAKHLAEISDSINALHPFRDGNGRSKRAFLQLYAKSLGFNLDYYKINSDDLLNAEITTFSTCNNDYLQTALYKCLSPIINPI